MVIFEYTDYQTLDLQCDALTQAGCSDIYTDTASGSRNDRKGLAEALATLSQGDTLVVWKLDRLGRNAAHLLTLTQQFRKAGIELQSIKDGVDTSTPGGKLFCGMLAVFAEFERDTIRQRTLAGLEAARSRGRFGGRRVQTPADQIRLRDAELGGDRDRVCKELKISLATYYRAMANQKKPSRPAPPHTSTST